MNIALVGRMGSGKTTVANALAVQGWVRHSWADPVRAIFAMAYEGDLTGEGYAETKERMYETSFGPRSGRELLQRIGTDALREQVDRDFWLRAGAVALRRQLAAGKQVVNDDTRFVNEAEALRELGFTIIRVHRPSLGDPSDLHPSETEQERIVSDHILLNDGTIDDLLYALGNIVRRQAIEEPFAPSITSEPWGAGNGSIYELLGDRFVVASVEHRGVWPPDTRVAGRLTCCGATQHTLSCPQWR